MPQRYWTDVTVTCDGTDYVVHPNAGPGNLSGIPGAATPAIGTDDVLFQAATFRGNEQLMDGATSLAKRYWNIALGIGAGGQDSNCTISASATAHDGALLAGTTPANTVYPYLRFEADLDTCTRHPMGSPEVKETYTELGAPVTFGWYFNGTGVGSTFAPLPGCANATQDGNETGVDCGGETCPPCVVVLPCANGMQDGNETGIDCGGETCPPCGPVDPCTNGVQDGAETGIDCGGGTCAACAPSCTNGVQDGTETGVDCGGDTCPGCAPQPCDVPDDCAPGMACRMPCWSCGSWAGGGLCEPQATYASFCIDDSDCADLGGSYFCTEHTPAQVFGLCTTAPSTINKPCAHDSDCGGDDGSGNGVPTYCRFNFNGEFWDDWVGICSN